MDTLVALSDMIPAAAALVPTSVVPDPGAGSMPPGFEQFTTVMGWAKWIGLGVTVVMVIILGVTATINSRRGEGGEIGGRLGWALGGIILISAAFTIVGFLAGA